MQDMCTIVQNSSNFICDELLNSNGYRINFNSDLPLVWPVRMTGYAVLLLFHKENNVITFFWILALLIMLGTLAYFEFFDSCFNLMRLNFFLS